MTQQNRDTASPPSALDLNRTGTAARTGRERMQEARDQHTDVDPTITAGDVDADWERAATIGDEAPGGDNPTPDQSVVDEIGEALGTEYQDDEELRGEEKVTARDRKRWELNPASSEDFKER